MGIEVPIILFLLAVPIFFFWRWFFRKRKFTGGKFAVSVLLATFISAPIVYAAAIIVWLTWISYYPSREFDKVRWERDFEKRYELSLDLIENKKLIGKTKFEIIELLGQEENTVESDTWQYYLGTKPSLMLIDPDVLVIEFNDGKAVKVFQRGT